jgi:tetratricopeptide (TPR) repeat protein
MTRLKSIAIAISLAVGTVGASSVFVPEVVQAAEAAKPKLSKAVAVPLQKAQKAMSEKNFDEALAELKKAQAVEKRAPHEDYQIDEFLGYIYIQQKNYAEAAKVYERMIDSGLMPEDQVPERTKAVAQIYFQEKQYQKSADWAKKWIDANGFNEDMGVLLGQAYYLLENHKASADTMTQVIEHLEKQGQTPKENYFQIVLSSYARMDDRPNIENSLKRIVRYYPKPNYWENLLDSYRRKSTSDRVTFGFYRLMDEVGVLKDKADYMEMAQLGIEMGVPGESQAIVEKGMQNGVLKSDDKAEQGRFERLLAAAKKQADADRASLDQQAAEAEKASQGQRDVGMGEAYLSYGQYDKAIAAMERGIKKGGVTDIDEAHISLGIAYLEKGDKERARQAFKSVKPDSKWATLAELWDIYAQSPGVSAASAASS